MPESLLEVAKRVDQFFMGASPVHEAMARLTATLGQERIPFAIAGAMAANAYGHRRTTADVDILIAQDDLDRFKQAHLGRGWVEKFEGSKNLRDAVAKVDIDTLIVGKFPGDGLPKPVAFPRPEDVAQVGQDGVPYVSLSTLLELKLASGMTAPHRVQDLADVIELIRCNSLPRSYAESLNSYVADKFRELWNAAQVTDDC